MEAWKRLRKGPSSTNPTPGRLSQLTISKILSRKLAASAQKFCHSRPWRRYRGSKDNHHTFGSNGRNYILYGNIGLSYACTSRRVALLDTGVGTNFVRENKLPDGVETQMSTGLLSNICNAYKNPLQMLGIVKLHVPLSST